jgi:uncharacterized membrane-anchored protein
LSGDWKVSYWSGVLGGLIMLVLFSYPIRKYFFAYNGWGKMSDWFKVHVIFGSILTLLLAFHTQFFHARSINGKFAFYSILIVSVSGLAGRFLLRRSKSGTFWAKVFSYWHVAHVPVIYSALIFVLIHIYAIHRY